MKLIKRPKLFAPIALGILALSFTYCMQWYGATFPGGRVAMEKYLRDSLRYPEAEQSAGKEEVVRVTFEISEKGIAHNPRMISLFGGSDGFTKEVERLIQDMPGWEPNVDRKGNPVASSDYAIVSFKLPDSLIKTPENNNDSTTYAFAEEMPQMKGGEKAFQTYLQWMVRYPQLEKEQGKDGTVYIYFEVTATGSITGVRCLKGVAGAPGLAIEAIRVMRDMPRWIPGKMNGKPVRVSMTVPIKFVLK